jgi:hypothetical protein
MLTLDASTPKVPAIEPSSPALNVSSAANDSPVAPSGKESKDRDTDDFTVNVVTFSMRVVVVVVVMSGVVVVEVVVVEVVVPDWHVGNPERVPREQETVASEMFTSTFSGPHVTLTELPDRMSSP